MLTGNVDVLTRSEVAGWAADPADPDAVVDVVIEIDGQIRGRVGASLPREDLARLEGFGAGRHGFVCRFEPPLSGMAAHAVVVAFAADGRPLANGRGRLHAETATPAPAPLRPLLVTSMGRSGSSLLMHRLGLQPEIVVPGIHPYETKIATYYAGAYQVLTAFDDGAARVDPNSMAAGLRLGGMPFDTVEQLAPGFFRRQVPAALSSCFRDLIIDFYAEAATVAGRRNVRMFAEKCDFAGETRAVLRGMFPGLRELVLVRELRDLFCSSRAFWQLDPDSGLERLRRAHDVLLDLQRNLPDGTMILRYEDLLRDPVGSGQRLRLFLDLTEPFVSDPVGEAALLPGHATASDPLSSIGRWQGETLPDSITSFVGSSEAFSQSFGYE